jgi:hypothetical protein
MRRGTAVAVLAILGLLVGCGQKSNGGGGTSPGAGASGPTSAGPGASGNPSSGPGATVALPASCTDVLALDDLDKVIGHLIAGQAVYIKGKPEPKINRTGRITCRYGVRKVGHNVHVPIDVGISAYSDEGSAADRVRYTVNQQRSGGATASDVALGGTKATALVAAGSALLVFAKNAETVAISVTKEVSTGDAAKAILVKLGNLVIGRLP